MSKEARNEAWEIGLGETNTDVVGWIKKVSAFMFLFKKCLFLLHKIFAITMKLSLLLKDIESLPEALQREVADFVVFLKLKNKISIGAGQPELTPEETAELERRWNEYQDQPNAAVDLKSFKKSIAAKYGL